VITAETIHEYLPSMETATKVRAALTAAGFTVGPLAANSITISAPVGTFEQVFQTSLRPHKRGGVECVAEDGSRSFELPRRGLPAAIAALVEAVTFTPPPDFGPSEFRS